ncbi:ankyrin repeat domain-containing protein [Metarhizium anisopliae]|nr:ankyrin repeat domain-containing protein [Metarhizium anisopliae]
MPCTLGICHPDSKSYSTWFRIYWKTRINWPQSKRHWDTATERKTPTHFTHLMVASYFGHGAIVKLLLKRGATDLEAKDGEYNRTALWWAARNEHVAVVKLLLEQGANIEARDGEYGGTPISWAAEYGHHTVVKLLLEKGADIESKGEYSGSTPLSRAAQNGHLAIAKLLLNKGADI